MSRRAEWRGLVHESIPGTLTWDESVSRLFRGTAALDLGCGPRPPDRSSRESGGRHIGLDFNFQAAKAARKAGQDFATVCADACLLPFRDQVFDAILCKAVLTAVVYQDACLKLLAEARRVLRPGGLLAVADFLEEDRTEYFTRRYAEGAARGLPRGAFEAKGPDGELLYTARHFTRDWVRDQIGGQEGLTMCAYKEVPALTRTGRHITAFMLAARHQ